MTTRREFLKTAATAPLAGAVNLSAAGFGMACLLDPLDPVVGMQYRDEPLSNWLNRWQNASQIGSIDLFEVSQCLSNIGSMTIPVLIDGLVDPRRQRFARWALEKIGAPAVPALADALRNGSRATREGAANVLCNFAWTVDAPLPLPPLFAALHDSSPSVRVGAAGTLVTQGENPSALVPTLLGVLDQGNDHERFGAVSVASQANTSTMSSVFQQALSDRDPSVRALAAKALLDSDPQRRDLIPVLVAQLTAGCTHDYARSIVAGALANNEPFGRAALQELLGAEHPGIVCSAMFALIDRRTDRIRVLRECLEHASAEVRLRATSCFKSSWADDRPVAPLLLIERLNDVEPSVRKEAIEALRCVDPPVELASTALRPLLRDADDGVRLEAAITLVQLGSKDQETSNVLLAMLPALVREQDSRFPRAAKALSDCRADFESVAPTLFNAWRVDNTAIIRRSALETLYALGLPAKEAIPMAVELLNNADEAQASGAACLLAEICKGSASALTDLLRHGDHHARARIIWAIRVIREKDDEIVPILAGGLNDASALVRQAAADALGEMAFRGISPRLRTTVPLLASALDDRDIAVRAAAAWALRRFKAAAKSAIPMLEKARNDPARIVGSNAEAALDEIRTSVKPATLGSSSLARLQ